MPPKKGRPGKKIFWSEEGRFESFKNWPLPDDSECTPAKLASAGFYSTASAESEDNVSCFMCGKNLDGWEHDDDPMSEHSKHCPTCPFMNLHLEENRVKTFKFWPHKKFPKTHQHFAEAGFVHAPTPDSWDNVRCFSCDKNLGGWEIDDDPIEEHTKRSKQCAFVKATLPDIINDITNDVIEDAASEVDVVPEKDDAVEMDMEEQVPVPSKSVEQDAVEESMPQPTQTQDQSKMAVDEPIEMEIDDDMTVGEYLEAQCEIQVLKLVRSCEARITEFKTTALQFRAQIAT
eukprot:m.15707 g.15707  ORF g.15707 m.15707 type:complete len:289 (+) comp10708_c0_seq1:104-970(+)